MAAAVAAIQGTTAGGGRNCREYGYAHKFNSGATLGFGAAAVCLKIYFSNSSVCVMTNNMLNRNFYNREFCFDI